MNFKIIKYFFNVHKAMEVVKLYNILNISHKWFCLFQYAEVVLVFSVYTDQTVHCLFHSVYKYF